MANPAEQFAYALAQAARVGWYGGQYALARRVVQPAERTRRARGPAPKQSELTAALLELFRRDLANVAAGVYAVPSDLIANPRKLVTRALAYWRDLPAMERRQRHGLSRDGLDDPKYAALPAYYRRNFHYQTGGYLTEQSAELYDTQVEVLFTGMADAMRRQGLVPLAEFFRGRDTRRAALLDVGCGTGRFTAMVKDNWPAVRVTGVDLSAAYLDLARRELGRRMRLKFAPGAAESLPVPDASQDAVSCVFLLHELPRPVRRQAAAEFFRVLKPGGRLVVVDSLQTGDRPTWDGMLAAFPYRFHEPYYADYLRTDLAALFGVAGLKPLGTTLAYLSKVAAFEKPAVASSRATT
jgi:ubiquinone/menaquinone biosynthesis C-methylase UbiE